jgi:hypothetical protein
MQLNKSQNVGLITVLIAGGSWFGTATAATLQVCSSCGHTTIQGAVDAAASNDVINIAAGHYFENITIAGKSLTLTGSGGGANGETLVSAAGRGPVFTLGSGAAGDTNQLISISGITVSGGNHLGGTGVGGGIQVRAGAYLHLSNTIVTQNYAVYGGGIGVDSPGAPPTTLSNCLVSDNTSPGTPRGFGPGGGIAVRAGSFLSIDQSTISRNQGRSGGGVWTDAGSQLVMTNTTVAGNTSSPHVSGQGPTDGDGGGLDANGDFSISDSFFINNTSLGVDGGGGIAIVVSDSGPHTITRSTITHNTVVAGNSGGDGGGIYAYATISGGSYSLTNSYIEQNLAGFGVWNEEGVTLNNSGTWIIDNAGGNLCTNSSNAPCE